jgi:hypothetical protein
LGDDPIFINITAVVEIDEFVMQGLPENGKANGGQHEAQQRHQPSGDRLEFGLAIW